MNVSKLSLADCTISQPKYLVVEHTTTPTADLARGALTLPQLEYEGFELSPYDDDARADVLNGSVSSFSQISFTSLNRPGCEWRRSSQYTTIRPRPSPIRTSCPYRLTSSLSRCSRHGSRQQPHTPNRTLPCRTGCQDPHPTQVLGIFYIQDLLGPIWEASTCYIYPGGELVSV